MNQTQKREIVSALLKAGRRDLANYFATAQPGRLDKIIAKHRTGILSDLRVFIAQSGAAPGAQKKAIETVMHELDGCFTRINEHITQL